MKTFWYKKKLHMNSLLLDYAMETNYVNPIFVIVIVYNYIKVSVIGIGLQREVSLL